MKNIKRKSIALLMAIAMIISCTATVSATEVEDASTMFSGTVSGMSASNSGISPQAVNLLVNLRLGNGCNMHFRASDTVVVDYRGDYEVIFGVAGGSAELTISINGGQIYDEVLGPGDSIRLPLGMLVPPDNISYSVYALSKCSYLQLYIGCDKR